YESIVRLYLRPAFGDTAIGRVTLVMVQAWRSQLLASGRAPNTVAKAYRVLSRIMRVAVNASYINRSPCIERGASADEVREMRFATAAQVDALAAAASS